MKKTLKSNKCFFFTVYISKVAKIITSTAAYPYSSCGCFCRDEIKLVPLSLIAVWCINRSFTVMPSLLAGTFGKVTASRDFRLSRVFQPAWASDSYANVYFASVVASHFITTLTVLENMFPLQKKIPTVLYMRCLALPCNANVSQCCEAGAGGAEIKIWSRERNLFR